MMAVVEDLSEEIFPTKNEDCIYYGGFGAKGSTSNSIVGINAMAATTGWIALEIRVFAWACVRASRERPRRSIASALFLIITAVFAASYIIGFRRCSHACQRVLIKARRHKWPG